MKRLIIIFFLLLNFVIAQSSGDYRSKTSGNWNAIGSWETYNGSAWVDAGNTPDNTSGAITILNGHTITITVAVSIDQTTIDSGGQITINSSIILTIADGTGTDLTINGILSNSGTISRGGSAQFTIGSGGKYVHATTTTANASAWSSLNSNSDFEYQNTSSFSTSINYGNLIFNTGGNVTIGTASNVSVAGNVTINTGCNLRLLNTSSSNSTISIIGNLVLSGTATFTGNVGSTAIATLNLGGSISSGSFSAGSGSGGFILNFTGGSSSVTFAPSSSFTSNGNITIASGKTVTLGSGITISSGNTLTLAGYISTSSNTVTIASGGSLSRTTGYIIGTLVKSSVSSSATFEVGTSNGYTPVSLANISGSADFTVKTTSAKHPNAVGSNVLGMYWTLTNGGITSADLQFTYLDGDVTGTEASYVIGKYSSSTWTFPATSINTTNNTASTSGVTSFSDFTLGESSALPVELTSFISFVTGSKVELNWQTATEVNNYGFGIERTAFSSTRSALNWETIGFVKGNGNSNSPKNYSFTDQPTGGKEFKYRLKQIDFNVTYEYSDEITAVLQDINTYKLDQNYPNPFNPITKISYTIPEKSFVRLRVYDMLAKEIVELVNKNQEAGRYEVTFDGSSLPSGAYFYKLEAGNYIEVKKLLLVK